MSLVGTLPLVQAMEEQFSANVVPGSVRPIDE